MAVQAVNSGLVDLILRGRKLRTDISDAIVGEVPVRRTISSASSVSFSVFDPNLDLMRDPFLNERSRMEIDGLVFELVQIKRGEDDTDSLVFEDAAISRLRRLKGPKKAFRDKMTRAEFVTMLAREAGIDCVSPWRGVKQPIGKSKAVGVRAVDEERGEGLDRTTRLTVKTIKANATQIQTAESFLALAAGDKRKPPQRAVVALICALIQESVMGTEGMSGPAADGTTSVGYLQAKTSSEISRAQALSIPYNYRRFMYEPWTGDSRGGAVKLAHANTSVPEICGIVQGNNNGAVDFAPHVDEARRWVEAYGGGGISYEVTTSERYAFQVKKDESYWDAIKRLAKEVNWRAFVSAGKLYFMADGQLLRSRPRLRIKSDHDGTGRRNYSPGIDTVAFDLATSKKANSATLAGRADTWQAPPGTVVILDGFGHADGRWIVSDIETDLTNPDFVAKLKRPSKPLPEPAASTNTRTVEGSSEGVPGKGAERAVAWAKKVIGVKQGSSKYNYWMGKVGGYDPWCSFWIGFLMREICGLECSDFGHVSYWGGWANGKRISRGQLKPGDIVVYGDRHVALYIGDGQIIGGNQSDAVTQAGIDSVSSAAASTFVRPNYK